MPEENNRPTLSVNLFSRYLACILTLRGIKSIPFNDDFHKSLVNSFEEERKILEKYFHLDFIPRLRLHNESEAINEIPDYLHFEQHGYLLHGQLHFNLINPEAELYLGTLPTESRQSLERIFSKLIKDLRKDSH